VVFISEAIHETDEKLGPAIRPQPKRGCRPPTDRPARPQGRNQTRLKAANSIAQAEGLGSRFTNDY